MLSGCVQAVFLAGDTLGKTVAFCALSTNHILGALRRVAFVHSLRTIFAQVMFSYAQKILQFSPLYNFGLYPFPTGPTTITNLIKE
jgi:hypothetical protein